MSKPSPSLDSSSVPIPEPRPLKRAASTASSVASLPTPPHTARKARRSSNHNGRSKARAAARPRNHRTRPNSSSHEEDSTDVDEHDVQDSQLRKRQKTSAMESVPERPEDEDVFWLSGGGADGATSATQQTATEKSPPTTSSTRYRGEMDQKSVRSLVSPPPSKRQVQAPVTPSHSVKSSLITPRRSGRLSSKNRTIDSDVEDSAVHPLTDSPNNPFLVSDDKAPTSPETPTPVQQGEKPTILYVFRGVRRAFANPHYNPDGNQENPRSLLPVEHPDFSPSEVCKPTILFKAERKKRTAVTTRAKRTESAVAAESSNLRKRTERRAVSPDISDDEDEGEQEGELPVPVKLFPDATNKVAGKRERTTSKQVPTKNGVTAPGIRRSPRSKG